MCYHAEYDRSALKGVVMDREPQKFGTLGPRPIGVPAWLTHENKPALHVCYHIKFGRKCCVKGCTQ